MTKKRGCEAPSTGALTLQRDKNLEPIRKALFLELSIRPKNIHPLQWLGRWGKHPARPSVGACPRSAEKGVIRNENKINSIDYFSYYLSGGDSRRCYNRDESGPTDDES